MTNWGAIVLAGGGAKRLGGGLKPTITVGGVRMLDRVLAAVAGAGPLLVVGPATLDVPTGVVRVQEDPPGGGPVPGIGAALPAMTSVLVAIVAGDLPLLTVPAVEALVMAVGDADGAIYVDDGDRPQWLCGVWRTAAVVRRVDEMMAERGSVEGASLRALLGPLPITRVRHRNGTAPPYLDCDTDSEIRQAEEWLTR